MNPPGRRAWRYVEKCIKRNLCKRVFQPSHALKSGNAADFIAIDYREPTVLNENNLYSHLTSNFSGNVDTVVINGKTVLRHRELTTIDRDEVFAKCREHASRLWSKI